MCDYNDNLSLNAHRKQVQIRQREVQEFSNGLTSLNVWGPFAFCTHKYCEENLRNWGQLFYILGEKHVVQKK